MLQKIIRIKQLKRVTTVFKIGMLTFLRNSPCARTRTHAQVYTKGVSLTLAPKGVIMNIVTSNYQRVVANASCIARSQCYSSSTNTITIHPCIQDLLFWEASTVS